MSRSHALNTHVQPRVGQVAAAWRYPVSSAGGERLPGLDATEEGLAGDRRFAVVDAVTGQTATPERERRWHGMTGLQSRLDEAGEPELRLHGGGWTKAAEAGPVLSAHFGFPAALLPYGSDGARHRYRPGHVHLLTGASLRMLQAALPGSDLDPARFRPNLVVETPPELEGGVEQDWIGRELLVGGVRLAVNKPCGRCSFTTLAQPGLALDRDVLRALIRGHARQFGVLCHVLSPGRMEEGDAVVLQ